MDFAQLTRRYWDDDAPTYDRSTQHAPTSALVRAAWLRTLEGLLPDAPARVLDCGAGTGFLTIMAGRLGHRVCALDLSAGMLAELRRATQRAHLDVDVVEGSAASPPPGPFDAVIERHLIWTLPDPAGTLASWRRAAPQGRLVLIESLWGSAQAGGRALAALRRRARRPRGAEPEHHAPYPTALRDVLPLGSGTSPDHLIEVAETAGWPNPRVERLRDVEWAEASELGPIGRRLGVTERFALVAG